MYCIDPDDACLFHVLTNTVEQTLCGRTPGWEILREPPLGARLCQACAEVINPSVRRGRIARAAHRVWRALVTRKASGECQRQITQIGEELIEGMADELGP